MRILAIETSCDETAIAIAEFLGPKTKPTLAVLANAISSQVKLHAKFGGVVPNLAKREHQKDLPFVLRHALKDGEFLIPNFQFSICKKIPKFKVQTIRKILEREPELFKQFLQSIIPLPPPYIDALAVTYGPGLAPALWVGVNFARALSYLWNKPLIPINHMEGHIYSAFLQKSEVENSEFPAVALLVSGGHTELVLMRGHGKYKIIGETLDDAAGEAFDKVARMLKLGYPGGPEIATEAAKFKRFKRLNLRLPRPMLNSKDYNFSFAGLKTAVFYALRDLKKKYPLAKIRPAIAKEFQDAAVEVLVTKTIRAAKEYKAKTIILGGGVAANKLLRQRLREALTKEIPNSTFMVPESSLCGDNALMIALAAYFSGNKKAWNKVHADANLRLSKQCHNV